MNAEQILESPPGNDEAVAAACVHRIFERRARRQPDAIALVCGDNALTYRQLNERANRLAGHLARSGVVRGELVGLDLPRGFGAIVAMLAVLKAGAGYMPLDADCPAQRLAAMLCDGHVNRVIGRAGPARALPAGIATIDPEDKSIVRLEAVDPVGDCDPQDVAYCMFSSGSTGAPKGILATHAGIVALVVGSDYVRLDEHESVLHAAPLAFDASTFEIWGALLNGGRLAILEAGDTTIAAIGATVARHTITTVWLTAALFHRVARAGFPGFGGVRQLLTGGDTLQPRAVAAARRALPDCRLINGYGPTETTTFAICHPGLPGDEDAASVPLGRAIGSARVYLLDAALRPVADGAPGEIFIGGAGIARGYLDRPGLTAEKFLPDPFAPPGSRMYRSGDLGCRLPDGLIAFLGRRDHQVKVNGFRVELGEIEAALLAIDGVRDACVVPREDAEGDKRLVAVIVEEEGAALGVAALRSELGRTLPSSSLPLGWVFSATLPLNANGKLDRAAVLASLPKDVAVRPDRLGPYVSPQAGLEEQVAAAWCRALGIDRVGRDDGFAMLDGSSIRAIDVAFALGRDLAGGRRIPAPFCNASLAQHAQAVAQALRSLPAAEVVGTGGDGGGDGPASQAQQQVWFLEQMDDVPMAYRFHARIRLQGTLDIAALQRALEALVDRHEILRTSFMPEGARLMRRVLDRVGVELRQADVSTLAPELRDAAVQACLVGELRHRFDISRAPLARWLLIRHAADDHSLLQSEHHFLHDGQSFRILLRDLAELYNATIGSRPPLLPRIEAQYGEHCAAEARWLGSADFTRQLGAWRERLAGFAPEMHLFADRARADAASITRGAQGRRLVPAPLVARIDAVAAALGLSRFAIMLSAFALLCARHGAQRRFVLGTALANRTSPRFQWTTGMFVNMLPVPFDVQSNRRFADFARETSEHVGFTLLHGEVPLGEIVKALGLTSRLQGRPPFSVGFSFHDSLAAQPHFDGLEATVEEALPNEAAKFDLDVVVIAGNPEHPGAIELVFEYAEAAFDAARIARMLGHYLVLLDGLCTDPGVPLKALPMASIAEASAHTEVCADGADGSGDVGAGIPTLIARRAASQPDAVALECGDVRMTYGQLDRRANQLAHLLRQRGVGAQTPVLVCMERSPELVLAMLAVMKAGGVYVPVDPDYPAQRLRCIAEDAGAPLVLVHGRIPSSDALGAAVPLCLRACAQELDAQPTSAPAVPAIDGVPAYCIFTSGSTGRPKGVAVEMRSLENHARSHLAACRLGPADRVLQACSPGFDASLEEIVPTLMGGATLVFAPGGHDAGADGFLDWIAERRVTVLDLPTSFWEAVMAHADPAFGHRFPSTVRLVVIGGESASWEHAALLARHALVPEFCLLNTYGPTEATIIATRHVVDLAARPAGVHGISLGRPLDGVRIHLLDDDLNPVAAGAVGEICIAGAGVARGYLGRPDLTAERFVPEPGGPPGSRMYRTSDLGRLLDDGRLEFMGRSDDQVKLRGFRVEPGEVETALLQLDAVREAAVVVRERPGVGRHLVGYVVPAGEAPSAASLRARLLERLPSYMVPERWVTLSHLPLTRHGKLDRQRLPEPVERTAPAEIDAEAGGELSVVLAIVRELLPDAGLSAHSDLLAAGLHSALTLRLMVCCRERFGVELRLRDIFRLATPASVAGHIRALKESGQ